MFFLIFADEKRPVRFFFSFTFASSFVYGWQDQFHLKLKDNNFIVSKTMKKKMKVSRRSSFEYRDDRSRELLEVFNRELGTRPFESVKSVLARVVNMPSSRFWVSEERAFRVVSAMLRGKRGGGRC